MTIEQMRQYVHDSYKSKSWAYKVSKMSDNQIVAIYYKLTNKKKD